MGVKMPIGLCVHDENIYVSTNENSAIMKVPIKYDIPNYNRQPRELVNDQNKAVFVNGRFSRGIKNFKPSPQVSNKKQIDYLMGEWMPGNIPGEYNWKGLNRNPMHQRHSSIGENVYY